MPIDDEGKQNSSTMSGDAEQAKARLRSETDAASRTIGEAREPVSRKASAIGSEMKDEAMARGDEMKHQATEGLGEFAEALRDASSKLSSKQPGAVTDLIGQAASGLEALSRSLERKSSGEMLEEVRNFGRRNPTGFIAGSVLAGFALCRFAGSSGSRAARSESASRYGADSTSPSAGTVPGGRNEMGASGVSRDDERFGRPGHDTQGGATP
jgi:hypothetical protein